MRACHYRVESICRVLTAQGVQVAPRTYRNWKTARPSGRALTDAYLTDALRATVNTPEGMYGRRKMTAHLRRHGHRVAACTVDRLMRDEGMCGLVRGGKHRTTIPADQGGRRAPDLLDRDFTAAAPNRKWVTDFTYCRTWSGFVYVAFVIDCFSRAIVGWHATQVKNTAMVTTALKMALWRRDHEGRQIGEGLIHHSDAGSQYTSIAFAETLTLESIAASIGSVGDAYEVSSPGGLHPRALSEPCVKVSLHTAPTVEPVGRAPCRQCANNAGNADATSASFRRARRLARRNRLYFRTIHFTRNGLIRCSRKWTNSDL
jgi:transposase InsO family protein